MSKHMEFYIQDDAASIQIGKNVYRRVSIPIDDFNAACDHYGFVKERTCEPHGEWEHISQTQEIRPIYCDCGEYLGMDRRSSLPFGIECKADMPNYCPNCGAKVVER